MIDAECRMAREQSEWLPLLIRSSSSVPLASSLAHSCATAQLATKTRPRLHPLLSRNSHAQAVASATAQRTIVALRRLRSLPGAANPGCNPFIIYPAGGKQIALTSHLVLSLLD